MRFPRRILIALALLTCTVSEAPAAVRGALVIRGRVLDDTGVPLHQAWIFVRGSRRLSALTDSLGGYEISVPGGTVDELSRQPVSVRVQARRRGFQIVTKEGATELGIELSVRRDSTEVWRYQVRSNQPAIAATIAAAAVLEPNPRVNLDVHFIATPGEQVENLPESLHAFEEVALVGPAPRHLEVAALPSPTPHPPRKGAARREPAVRTPPTEVARREPPAETPRTVATAPRDEPGPVVIRPGAGSTERARVYRPAEPREEDRQAERERKRRERAEEKARKRLAREEQERTAREERERREAVAKAEREVRVAALKAERETRASGTSAGDGDKPGPEDSSERGAPQETERSRPPSRLTRIEPRFHSRDAGLESEPTPGAGTEAALGCSCRVRGTVEIDTERPLPRRTRVEVWLEGLRSRSDRVELFMGSPRAFDLGWVACGARPIAFTTTSKQRFQVRLPEAVHCRPGTSIQVRVVLEPYRRGTSP